MTERYDEEYQHGWGGGDGSVASPATWPRDPRDRTQPRSRLRQALGVARRGASGEPEAVVAEADAAVPAATGTEPLFAAATAEALPPSEWGAARATQHAEPEANALAGAGSADVVVDLRDPGTVAATDLARRDSTHYGLGGRWGSSWQDSAQGWVATPTGGMVWRPVVTTTPELANWDIDTYLGVVTAEVAMEAEHADHRELGDVLARGRGVGVAGLVDEAIERGAHAVVGVTLQYTSLGRRLLLTMTGTAVTLREKAR